MSSYTIRNNFSTKTFDGNIRDYFAWFENVGKLLDSEGLKFTILKSGERGYIPYPVLGKPLVDRCNNGSADEKDFRLRDQIRTTAAEYQAKCRKALLIIVSTLDSGPLARTENTRIYPKANVDARETILKTMDELKTYYGTWSPKNQQTITDKMYQVEPARTPAEVERPVGKTADQDQRRTVRVKARVCTQRLLPQGQAHREDALREASPTVRNNRRRRQPRMVLRRLHDQAQQKDR